MNCDSEIPPRNGEGDHAQHGGGVPLVLISPIKTIRTARRLRKDMSLPEVLLWQELRKRPGGFRFRRQFPVAPYVIDFACLEVRLGIEIDGEAHNRGDRPERDGARVAALERQGFAMLRIGARDVLKDLQMCVDGIVAACGERGPLHHPSDGPPPRSGEDLR